MSAFISYASNAATYRATSGASGHPPLISCGVTAAAPAPVGDVFILTTDEQASLTTTVNAYNAHIQARANALGWAYVDVNPTYNGEFNVFSPAKLFVAVGSTVTDVAFVVAGSNVPARVTGFGAVFADVGRAHSTTIEYFDAAGNRLLTLAAPRRSDETGLSFVGAVFDSGIVTRVRIRSGDTPLGATVEDNVKGAGRKRDLAAMDDFIYGEPRASR